MYICNACAESKGLTWPTGHLATIHEGECPYCKQPGRRLSAITDWCYPGQEKDEPLVWD
jgi:hypothetical protein